MDEVKERSRKRRRKNVLATTAVVAGLVVSCVAGSAVIDRNGENTVADSPPPTSVLSAPNVTSTFPATTVPADVALEGAFAEAVRCMQDADLEISNATLAMNPTYRTSEPRVRVGDGRPEDYGVEYVRCLRDFGSQQDSWAAGTNHPEFEVLLESMVNDCVDQGGPDDPAKVDEFDNLDFEPDRVYFACLREIGTDIGPRYTQVYDALADTRSVPQTGYGEGQVAEAESYRYADQSLWPLSTEALVHRDWGAGVSFFDGPWRVNQRAQPLPNAALAVTFGSRIEQHGSSGCSFSSSTSAGDLIDEARKRGWTEEEIAQATSGGGVFVEEQIVSHVDLCVMVSEAAWLDEATALERDALGNEDSNTTSEATGEVDTSSDSSQPRILNINGVGEPGVATALRRLQTNAGYDMTDATNGFAISPESVIYFRDGYEDQARELASLLDVDVPIRLGPPDELTQLWIDKRFAQIARLGEADLVVVLGTDNAFDVQPSTTPNCDQEEFDRQMVSERVESVSNGLGPGHGFNATISVSVEDCTVLISLGASTSPELVEALRTEFAGDPNVQVLHLDDIDFTPYGGDTTDD